MLVIAYVFNFTPFCRLVTIFVFTFVCLLIPSTFPVNKFRLVFTNLFLFDYFGYDLFLCNDFEGPSLPLSTYPKFNVVETLYLICFLMLKCNFLFQTGF